MTGKVLIPIATCRCSIREMLDRIETLKLKYPNHEIFMDGDLYAIVARPRMDRYLPNMSADYKAMLNGVSA